MLELSYNITPDEHGVIDGRDLARALISDAYRLLAPYAGACPGCTDNLFSVIANEAIGEHHANKKPDGSVSGVFMTALPDGPEKDAAIRAHLEAAAESTARLMATVPGGRHKH